MNDPIEAPNREPMSELHCASCPAVLEFVPGTDQRGQVCAACQVKLEALLKEPTPPQPDPNAPREVDASVPVASLRDGEKVLAASDAVAPELLKVSEEAVAAGPIIHANYCKTKATEPGLCSCGADPSVPPPTEEVVSPTSQRPPDPVLMTGDEAKALKSVDIMGNGPGYMINDHATGRIIPFASGLQIALTPNGCAAVFGVPTEFLDPPEVPPEQRRIQVTNVRVVVAKLLLCSRPSIMRLKNKSDEWWGAAASMLHRLPDADRFEFVTEQPADAPATGEAPAEGAGPVAVPDPAPTDAAA